LKLERDRVLAHFACTTFLNQEPDQGLDYTGLGVFLDELTARMDATCDMANSLLFTARGERPVSHKQPEQPEPLDSGKLDGSDSEVVEVAA
jgi:hypothetical protein